MGDSLTALSAQSFQDFEIIAVDNESTDKTREILESFKDKLNIKIVSLPKEEFNYVKACNLGAEHAAGEIIGYLSGHSIPLLDDYIESGIRHFSNKKVAAVYGPALPSRKATFSEVVYYSSGLGYQGRLKQILSGRPKVVTKPQLGLMGNTNSFLRKSLWDQHSFNEKLALGGEDTGWAVYWLKQGYEVIWEPHMVIKHSHGVGFLKMVKQFYGWWSMY